MNNLINYLSFFILLFFLPPIVYFLLLAIGSVHDRSSCTPGIRQPTNRFIIAIPAHNEANVIQNTIKRLCELNYPQELFSIHVVADHCSDNTAYIARQAGSIVHERNEGVRRGKGEALSWLFQQILIDDKWDAVVIFDADTQVDRDFLCVMDTRLAMGDQVIQGQHVISNPDNGLFPALTWAMFLIDNRFQNMGRTNLGWSAKNMGDSICFRSNILRKIGWGDGLTEDYQLRQRLLLEDIKIVYEPKAIGSGEAPLTWSQAQMQRARWLKGTYNASNKFIQRLLSKAINQRNGALMESSVQARFPSYSTLALLTFLLLLIQLLFNRFYDPDIPLVLIIAWTIIVCILIVYPLIGLALEHAPIKAYLAILIGPFFIIWRTWLALIVRFGHKPITWIRTTHGVQR